MLSSALDMPDPYSPSKSEVPHILQVLRSLDLTPFIEGGDDAGRQVAFSTFLHALCWPEIGTRKTLGTYSLLIETH